MTDASGAWFAPVTEETIIIIIIILRLATSPSVKVQDLSKAS